MNKTDLERLLSRARGIAALRGVLDSGAGRDFLALLGLLTTEKPEPEPIADACSRLWGELAHAPEPLLEDAWQAHLVERFLEGEHPFALAAEKGDLSTPLLEQVRRDLRTLRALFDLDAETLLGAVEEAVPELAGLWVPPPGPDYKTEAPSRRALAGKFETTADWGELAGTLAEHYALYGAGPLGRYRAFRWKDGDLQAVPHPDPVRLSGLIGYERERRPLLKNTERLLVGLPSHHALLYGPPGTGKSSTVKAILNEYADRGLKLVELAKGDLKDLPRVLDALRGRGLRFVIFKDDLSFEEREVEYKALKALLEGSVEEPPENVRIYATSNRRNLIRENFADREDGPGDDVHARDTMQEKQSLAARFGLRVTFPAPDQKRYLRIVEGLARERALEASQESLREEALLWDRWHAGRS